MDVNLTSCLSDKKKISAGLYIVMIMCSVFAGLFIWNYTATTSKVINITYSFNKDFEIVKYNNFTNPGELSIIEDDYEYVPFAMFSYMIEYEMAMYNEYHEALIKNDTDYYLSFDTEYFYSVRELVWAEKALLLDNFGIIDVDDAEEMIFNKTISGLKDRSVSLICGNPVFVSEISIYGNFSNYQTNETNSSASSINFELFDINEFEEVLNNTFISDTHIEFIRCERVYYGSGTYDYDETMIIEINGVVTEIKTGYGGP